MVEFIQEQHIFLNGEFSHYYNELGHVNKDMLLHDAQSGKIETFKCFIKNHNYKTTLDELHHAVIFNHLELAELILDNIDESSFRNWVNSEKLNEIFIDSCFTGNLKMVQFLISTVSHSINLNYRNDQGFINACTSGNLELVEYLLSLKLNRINIWSQSYSALINAFKENHVSILDFLLSKGKKPDELCRILIDHKDLYSFLRNENFDCVSLIYYKYASEYTKKDLIGMGEYYGTNYPNIRNFISTLK